MDPSKIKELIDDGVLKDRKRLRKICSNNATDFVSYIQEWAPGIENLLEILKELRDDMNIARLCNKINDLTPFLMSFVAEFRIFVRHIDYRLIQRNPHTVFVYAYERRMKNLTNELIKVDILPDISYAVYMHSQGDVELARKVEEAIMK